VYNVDDVEQATWLQHCKQNRSDKAGGKSQAVSRQHLPIAALLLQLLSFNDKIVISILWLHEGSDVQYRDD